MRRVGRRDPRLQVVQVAGVAKGFGPRSCAAYPRAVARSAGRRVGGSAGRRVGGSMCSQKVRVALLQPD
ncbi:hypothetical protein AB0D27_44605, partial [Streptomyces sp. NPDC048415]|uniref:hypothetical protein n=1 Tax=Streptomyces sp. NPDC048415 TaxID=3154822 RepID=UPI003428F609